MARRTHEFTRRADAAAVHLVLTEAVERARAGGGPTLVEAVTYRIDAHTNADDHLRYRSKEELAAIAHEDAVAPFSTSGPTTFAACSLPGVRLPLPPSGVSSTSP